MYFSAFQQAVVRNMNDKNAQLQKQLENVVREGMGFILQTYFLLSVYLHQPTARLTS